MRRRRAPPPKGGSALSISSAILLAFVAIVSALEAGCDRFCSGVDGEGAASWFQTLTRTPPSSVSCQRLLSFVREVLDLCWVIVPAGLVLAAAVDVRAKFRAGAEEAEARALAERRANESNGSPRHPGAAPGLGLRPAAHASEDGGQYLLSPPLPQPIQSLSSPSPSPASPLPLPLPLLSSPGTAQRHHQYSQAFGVYRGRCRFQDCLCRRYACHDPATGGPCLSCGHFPSVHAVAGKAARHCLVEGCSCEGMPNVGLPPPFVALLEFSLLSSLFLSLSYLSLSLSLLSLSLSRNPHPSTRHTRHTHSTARTQLSAAAAEKGKSCVLTVATWRPATAACVSRGRYPSDELCGRCGTARG